MKDQIYYTLNAQPVTFMHSILWWRNNIRQFFYQINIAHSSWEDHSINAMTGGVIDAQLHNALKKWLKEVF